MSLLPSPVTFNFNTFFTVNNIYSSPTQSKESAKSKRPSKNRSFTSFSGKKSDFSDSPVEKRAEIIEKRVIFRECQGGCQTGEAGKLGEIVGYGLLVFIFVFFSWFCLNFFGVLLSHQREGGHFLMEEGYYCLLIPLALPLSMVAAYANWIAVKFFRHN